MKYDYSEEFMRVMLKNISRLLQLPNYRTVDDTKLCVTLVKAMNPVCFIKPTESELIEYIAKVKRLQPTTPDGKKAVRMAEDDLYYLLRLRGNV